MKGCIIARDPNNKYLPWKVYKSVKKLQKLMNFDIFINTHQSKKIELILNSKVFVNISSLDSGPRAQEEAFQLNTSVLSMSHIGSSDLIEIGKNGEIAENFDDIPNKLKIMLDNYDNYSLNTFKKYLKSDVMMPNLVQNIKDNYKKNLMPKKALITGVSGQDGAYLSKLLLKKGYHVIGGDRRAANNTFWRLKKLKILNEVEIINFDICEQSNIIDTIKKFKPDEVYNLAAQSFVGSSFDLPIVTSDSTAIGTTRLLEAIRKIQLIQNFIKHQVQKCLVKF